MLRKPKISVIVPFYNSECYIKACLDSIIQGTHIRYEIICVNDGSTDKSVDIVQEYCSRYKNIRLISSQKNIGLYRARLLGVAHAKGSYIGFVDSDDYVSEGFFDGLFYAARKNGADIAVAQIVNVDLNGVKYVQTRCSKFPYLIDGQAESSNLYDMYWQQSGKCYHWHVVWNKLYRRRLWRKVIHILERQKQHLVMLEDFIFSSVVLSQVKSYVSVTESKYFYVAHSDSSIQDNKRFEIIKNNIISMNNAFEFVEGFLKTEDMWNLYNRLFEEWRQRYGRYWKRNVSAAQMTDEEKDICIGMLEQMVGGVVGDILAEDEYYYELADINPGFTK